MSKLFCIELHVSSQAILYWVEIQQDIYAFGYEAVKPPAGAESESVQLNESFLLRERYPQWWWRIISEFFFLCSSLSKWLFVGNVAFHEYFWYLWLFLRNVCRELKCLCIFLPSASKFGVETKTIAADFGSLDIYSKIEDGLAGLEIGVLGKTCSRCFGHLTSPTF